MMLEFPGAEGASLALPNASASALEARAAVLFDMIRPMTPQQGDVQPRWQPDYKVTAVLTEQNLVGPLWRFRADEMTGRVIERAVAFKERAFHFTREACEHLDSLAEDWASAGQISGLTTTDGMRDRLLRWCGSALESGVRTSSVDHVLSDFRSALRIHEVWVQISGVEVEDQVPFGKVTLLGVSAGIVSRIVDRLLDRGLDPQRENRVRQQLEKDWQGRTAAVFHAYGDKSAVVASAVEQVERSCAVLRVINPISRSPIRRSYLQPFTLRSQSNVRCLLIDPDTEHGEGSKSTDGAAVSGPIELVLSREAARAIWEDGGLKSAHELLACDNPTKLQQDLIRCLLIFSRQALSADPVEKVIYTLAALESFLLAGSVKKRLIGMLVPAMSAEKIESVYHDAKTLRDKFLHHGLRIDERKVVEDFLTMTWSFFSRIIARQDEWKTKEALGKFLDDQFKIKAHVAQDGSV